MKKCSKCNKEKESTDFYKNNSTVSGLAYYCKSCSKESNKKWLENNSNWRIAYFKRYRSDNSERLSKIRKEVRNRNPDKARSELLMQRFGITVSQYNEILERQEHRCAICKTHEQTLNRRLFVDHDHVTGNVRGLLCHKCNSALGYLGDTCELLYAEINYLNERNKK